MKLVLLTADKEDCNLCEDAEKQFKKAFWKEIESGEARIVDVDSDEEFQEKYLTHEDMPLAPVVLLVTDNNKIIVHIETQDIIGDLKEASPVTAEADKAAVESSSS